MFLKKGFHLIASKSLAENLPFGDFLQITAINGVIVNHTQSVSMQTRRATGC